MKYLLIASFFCLSLMASQASHAANNQEALYNECMTGNAPEQCYEYFKNMKNPSGQIEKFRQAYKVLVKNCNAPFLEKCKQLKYRDFCQKYGANKDQSCRHAKMTYRLKDETIWREAIDLFRHSEIIQTTPSEKESFAKSIAKGSYECPMRLHGYVYKPLLASINDCKKWNDNELECRIEIKCLRYTEKTKHLLD